MMTTGLDVAVKRTRESTSKVRTGCSTCKLRRVKCDEAKPICRRCAIGSRKCVYNAVRAASSRNVITIYLPPLQRQPVFFSNNRDLDFFDHNIAAKLDGQFDSKFWSKLVLQLSHSEPSIRHAVSAISIIYQDVESSLRHPTGYVNASPKAQQEWNIAVRSLSTRIQAYPNSNLVPLVCCLLFTCIEFLRGNIESSMFHVQNGFNILAALRYNCDVALNPRTNIASNDRKAIEDHIVPVFLRLNVLCSLAGRMTPQMYSPTAERDSPQKDLTDSRRRLYEVSDICLRFIDKATLKAAIFQIDIDDLVEQVKLQTRLDAWRDLLDDLLQRMQAAGSSANQDALNILLIHFKVIYIWIRVCTTSSEMAPDSYHSDFEELLHYAEQIVKPGLGLVAPQPLSFDMQILGPLYYTALKCRHPVMRRRAMEMLQLAPRREGLWNGHYAYVTAKRMIELEEEHLNGQELPDETSRLHGLPLPDDESRIYHLGEIPLDYKEFNYSVMPSPVYPGTLEAVFRTKPWGLLGEWQSTTEYIKL
ncbi:uncharacterized protein TrAFT101_008145 [Trichoderma asperellum]|uniref:Zn(2)-C6 fungal-type domain-containing protein n=1 Tax=Trichoderma asperellum (strain ATCC 204424 / CBS 433.97 / NBRC 101777) TaxID=1042311 RepID=A0A2T3YQN4_TRIA4|nr:hypothetical protein M441DRAFT_205940 [Trichoderma asperellum CBS 433.97]PTB34829.1 hypothetical protein M441DRAFT_205940 [Trichoderma asperellum CBS 433.97]UKZ93224.1 hypothetical protein TrAFT101_008145 [Trichoderma asperellum]